MFRRLIPTMMVLLLLLSACGARSSLLEFEEGRDGGVSDSTTRQDTVGRVDSTVRDSVGRPDRDPPPAPCAATSVVILELPEVFQAPSVAEGEKGGPALVTFGLGNPSTVVSTALDPNSLEPITDVAPIAPGTGGTLSEMPFGDPGFTFAFQNGSGEISLAIIDDVGSPIDIQPTGLPFDRRRPAFAVSDFVLGLAFDERPRGFTLLSGPVEEEPTVTRRTGRSPHLAPSDERPELMNLAYAANDFVVVHEQVGPFGEVFSDRTFEIDEMDGVRVVRTARAPSTFVAVGGSTQMNIYYDERSVTTPVEDPVHDLAATYLESSDVPLVFSSTGPDAGRGTFVVQATTADGQVLNIATERVDQPVDIAATYSRSAGHAIVVWTTNNVETHTLRGATVTCR